MIGRSLNERHLPARLAPDVAEATLRAALDAHARALVDVRRQDPALVAVLVLAADKPAGRLCKSLGFEVRPGGSGVFGVPGDALARLLAPLLDAEAAWLAAAAGARETKLLLVAGGLALASVEAADGRVDVRVVSR